MHCSNAHMSSSWDPVWSENNAQSLFDSPAENGKLGCELEHAANLRRGFDLWYERDQICEKLALGGKGLLVGLIYAFIARNGGNLTDLYAEVAALGGDHLLCPVQDLLHEFAGTDPERHLWHELVPGHYALTL